MMNSIHPLPPGRRFLCDPHPLPSAGHHHHPQQHSYGSPSSSSPYSPASTAYSFPASSSSSSSSTCSSSSYEDAASDYSESVHREADTDEANSVVPPLSVRRRLEDRREWRRRRMQSKQQQQQRRRRTRRRMREGEETKAPPTPTPTPTPTQPSQQPLPPFPSSTFQDPAGNGDQLHSLLHYLDCSYGYGTAAAAPGEHCHRSSSGKLSSCLRKQNPGVNICEAPQQQHHHQQQICFSSPSSRAHPPPSSSSSFQPGYFGGTMDMASEGGGGGGGGNADEQQHLASRRATEARSHYYYDPSQQQQQQQHLDFGGTHYDYGSHSQQQQQQPTSSEDISQIVDQVLSSMAGTELASTLDDHLGLDTLCQSAAANGVGAHHQQNQTHQANQQPGQQHLSAPATRKLESANAANHQHSRYPGQYSHSGLLSDVTSSATSSSPPSSSASYSTTITTQVGIINHSRALPNEPPSPSPAAAAATSQSQYWNSSSNPSANTPGSKKGQQQHAISNFSNFLAPSQQPQQPPPDYADWPVAPANSNMRPTVAATMPRRPTVGVVEPRVVPKMNREQKGAAETKVPSVPTAATTTTDPSQMSPAASPASNCSNRAGNEANFFKQFEEQPSAVPDGYCITEKLPHHFKEALRRRRQQQQQQHRRDDSSATKSSCEGDSLTTTVRRRDQSRSRSRLRKGSSIRKIRDEFRKKRIKRKYSKSSSSFSSDYSSSGSGGGGDGEEEEDGNISSDCDAADAATTSEVGATSTTTSLDISSGDRIASKKLLRRMNKKKSDRGEVMRQRRRRPPPNKQARITAENRTSFSEAENREERERKERIEKIMGSVSAQHAAREEQEQVANNKSITAEGEKNERDGGADRRRRLRAQTTIVSTDSATDDRWLYCPHPGCTFWTRKPERMQRHALFHQESTRHYVCPDCHGQKFYSLAKVLKHDRKFHTGVKDYECRLCDAEVTDIVVHMKVHNTEKKFVCSDCPMRFRHKNSLIRHMCQHTGERPYACDACDAAFIAPHRLKEHIVRCHSGKNRSAPSAVDNLLLEKKEQEQKRLRQQRHNPLDEESRVLVADLMLEGCSDVILTDENATPIAIDGEKMASRPDAEVEIIEERKCNNKMVTVQQPQFVQQRPILQPLVVPAVTTLQPMLMTLVAGVDGQVYLVPSQQAAAIQPQPQPQPQTIILSAAAATPWPTPPSSVSPSAASASILSPTSILSPECNELQNLDAIHPQPGPTEPLKPVQETTRDIVTSALIASDVLSEQEADEQQKKQPDLHKCDRCGREFSTTEAFEEHKAKQQRGECD